MRSDLPHPRTTPMMASGGRGDRENEKRGSSSLFFHLALSHDKTDFLRDSKHDPSCLILPMVGFRLRPARHRRCHPELVELLGQRPKSTRRSRSGILAGLRSE